MPIKLFVSTYYSTISLIAMAVMLTGCAHPAPDWAAITAGLQETMQKEGK